MAQASSTDSLSNMSLCSGYYERNPHASKQPGIPNMWEGESVTTPEKSFINMNTEDVGNTCHLSVLDAFMDNDTIIIN